MLVGKIAANLARCAVLLPSLVSTACGGTLAEIPRGQHPLSGGAQPIAVDSAPPPARIDVVSPAPDRDCAWADGQWTWESNRWVWVEGAWVRPAPDCYYADSLIVWVPTVDGKGVLFYTHGQWYSKSGELCDAPPRCNAS
jgi:hypothetical protein